jgi:predicted Zn-dependent protease
MKRIKPHTAPLLALLLALLPSLSPATQAQAQPQPQPNPARPPSTSTLPNLGDGAAMAPAAERRLGDRIARELYRDPDYVDDPVIMDYVQSIWQPLLAAARLRGELPPELDEAYAWEVLLGRDRTVNAFALPGAYFGLHLGLVGVVASRDELASVLAHEISHVTQRHISRMIARQSEQTPWMIAAMVLGMLAASKSPNAANALIVGGQAVSAQSQLNFSRDMEREADRVGFGMMTEAGFEPQGFVGMFEKLQQASRLNDSGGFPYLRSHPLTTERMADMQARIGPPNAAPKAKAFTGNPLVQAMVGARARVLSNAAVDALRTWATAADATRLGRQPPAQQAGVLYGATLAALKLRDYAAATALWARLDSAVRSDAAAAPYARWMRAELWLAQGEGASALAALQAAAPMSAKDRSRAELFLLAQASTQAGQAAMVTQDLQTWVADHPRDAQAWQLLSGAYSAQRKVLSAVRAEAEGKAAQLDYPGALARLKAAQDMVRSGAAVADHFEASILDTRARQLELLVREQALER